MYITIKPAGICAIYFPIFFIFLEFHFRKSYSKNFIGLDCVVEIDVVQLKWVTLSVYVMSPYRECLHLILPTPIGYTLAGVMTTGQGFIACCRKTFDKTGTLQEKSQTQHIYLYSSGALAQTSLFFCAHRWLFSVGL